MGSPKGSPPSICLQCCLCLTHRILLQFPCLTLQLTTDLRTLPWTLARTTGPCTLPYPEPISSLGSYICPYPPSATWVICGQSSITVLRPPRVSLYKCTVCLLNKGNWPKDPVEENPAYIPLSHVPECKVASTQLGQLFLICSYALYGLVLECHTTPCPPPCLHQADHQSPPVYTTWNPTFPNWPCLLASYIP